MIKIVGWGGVSLTEVAEVVKRLGNGKFPGVERRLQLIVEYYWGNTEYCIHRFVQIRPIIAF